jgi:hypothetical protein
MIYHRHILLTMQDCNCRYHTFVWKNTRSDYKTQGYRTGQCGQQQMLGYGTVSAKRKTGV